MNGGVGNMMQLNNGVQLAQVFGRFDESGVDEFKEIDSSQGENDYRRIYLVNYTSGRSLAIKITNNCFTTPERIMGWSDLIERYNAAGIYSPKIVATNDGKLWFRANDCIVYAEEHKKYLCVDEFVPAVAFEEYEADIYTMIGKIAALPAKLYPWQSAYCLYDPFCAEDETDENYWCAKEWYQLFSQARPERKEDVERIWDIYLRLRTALEPQYRALPQTAFQADLNRTNIMLDGSRRFAGVIDFNVSGTETILNYALCESVHRVTTEAELAQLSDPQFRHQQDRILLRRLGYIQRHYTFTRSEVDIFPGLYNMVVPFRWPTFSSFRSAVLHEKHEYYNSIIDWVWYQLTREFTLGLGGVDCET